MNRPFRVTQATNWIARMTGSQPKTRRSAPFAVGLLIGLSGHSTHRLIRSGNATVSSPSVANRAEWQLPTQRTHTRDATRPSSLRIHRRKAVSEVSLPGSRHSSPSADDPFQAQDECIVAGRLPSHCGSPGKGGGRRLQAIHCCPYIRTWA
jgi:hypothetical protein